MSEPRSTAVQGSDELFEAAAAGLALAGLLAVGNKVGKFLGKQSTRRSAAESTRLSLKAFDHLKAGRFNEAAGAWSEALAKNPQNAIAANQLVELFLRSGVSGSNLDHVLNLSSQAVQWAKPEDRARYVHNHGEVRLRRGEISHAIVAFEDVWLTGGAQAPTAPLTLQRLGQCHAALRQHETAVEYLRQAIALAPRMVENYRLLAASAQELGSYGPAIDALIEGLGVVEGNRSLFVDSDWVISVLINDIGNAHYRKDDPVEGERVHRLAMEACPRNPYATMNCAIACARRGDVADLRSLLESALADARPRDPHLLSSILAEGVVVHRGDVILDVLVRRGWLSEESYRSHLRVWRSYREAGTGTKHTYNFFGEVDMKKSISVTGSQVGFIGQDTTTRDVRVGSVTSVVHGQAEQVEAALAAIESVLPTSGLAPHEQTAARADLTAIRADLAEEEGPERAERLRFNVGRLVQLVRSNAPLVSAAAALAALLGVA